MPCTFLSLPNEILIQIFKPFATAALLPLAPVSPHFSSLILRILHHRLLLAASLPSYKLLLEAYHPTRKYSEPYLFCTYLGTPGLSPPHQGQGPLFEEPSAYEGYGSLSRLWSRFRPERPGVEGRSAEQRHSNPSSHPVCTNAGDGGNDKVEHTISLDSHELFTQFCVIANLVELGPRRGLFLSAVNVEDEKVMRLWRHWLEEMAEMAEMSRREEEEKKRSEKTEQDEEGEEEIGESSSNTKRRTNAAEEQQCNNNTNNNNNILWTDHHHNLGLVVAVSARTSRPSRTPILISANDDDDCANDEDDEPVSYVIQIKELLVRTTRLLLAVEKSLEMQTNVSGKAMVFGSFASTTATVGGSGAAADTAR